MNLIRNIKKLGVKRFIFLFVIPLFFLCVIYVTKVEPNAVRLQKQVLYSDALAKPCPKPINILHITDLHLNSDTAVRRLQKTLEITLPQSPDIALITGDFGLAPKEDTRLAALAYLQVLVEAMPTYAVLGNHDYFKKLQPEDDIVNLIKDAGIKLLINESTNVIVNGMNINIVGLADLWHAAYKPESCLTRKGSAESNGQLTLLLAHNPDAMDKLTKYDWDIAFSGHAHGGQVKLPFIDWYPFGPLRRNKQFAKPVLHDLGDHQFLSVSAGIGNHHEIRLFSPPDCTILSIIPQEDN